MSTNKELKELVKAFNDEYKKACHDSREKYIKELPAGQPIPPEGKILLQDYRDTFEASCREKRAKAREILEGEIKQVKTKMSEAPSADAVNTISLLKLRKDVSKEELGSLVEKYGDNPIAFKALREIAHDHDIHDYDFTSTGLEERMEDLEGLSRSLSNSISTIGAEKHGDGFASMIDWSIDTVFPEEG